MRNPPTGPGRLAIARTDADLVAGEVAAGAQLALLDRCQGAAEALARFGVILTSLFRSEDLAPS
ncbi:hypothetical protein [Streptomyces sp. NPDC050416]|uniref:hypothetical protein n=1 Tax=Streptomyces sp. NPDC050416 TaxID=3365611 RepID=UPI0037A139B5